MINERQNNLILFFLAPVICLMLSVLLLLSHRGRTPEPRPARLEPLTEETGLLLAGTDRTKEPEVLLLTEQEDPLFETVRDTLREMKLPYTVSDSLRAPDGTELLPGIRTVLVLGPSLPALCGEEAAELLAWTEGGGSLGVLCTPAGDWLRIAGHKLGIREAGSDYRLYTSLRPEKNVFPVFGSFSLSEGVEDYLLPVHLEADCRVLLRTADSASLPLMWTLPLGKGRAAVCNNSLIQGKDSRGYVYLLMKQICDRLAFPIINAGMIFIDDFPAPQPEGFDEELKAQYGLSTQSFYRSHWWPDMKRLSSRYGLRYTGVLIETYNDLVTPPFLPDSEDASLIRYYASELLQSGGEMGLHGYNHQPLCPDGWPYAGEGYRTWPSGEAMGAAVRELVRYGTSFLPETSFTSYVPPSNYLSPEGQKVLLENVPKLEAISGLYLPEDGVHALVQEFREEADGSVSVPRVTSGFSMDAYQRLVAAGELGLHGVFSHFIHPDDVLDEDRGALLGWEQMRNDFDAELSEVTKAFPSLRWCTATEAAAAVQRADRLQVERIREQDRLTLRLSPFYDEAWLCLCAEEPPARIEGAELFPQSGCFWLKATRDTVILEWDP